MKNSEAAELFNILNSAKNITVGSDLETAVLKTLRKMNTWRNDYLSEINDIEDRNAATVIKDGVTIRATKVLSRTIGDRKEEFLQPEYTIEGITQRNKEVRAFNSQEAVHFEIISTDDDHAFSNYEKIVLREYGFLKDK